MANETLRQGLIAKNENVRKLFTSFGFGEPNVEMIRTADCTVILTSQKNPIFNGIFCPRFDPENALNRCREITQRFRRKNVPGIFWLSELATPKDLTQFLVQNDSRLMATEVDLAFAVSGFTVPEEILSQAELVRVRNEPEYRNWAEIFFENFDWCLQDLPFFVRMIEKSCDQPNIVAHWYLLKSGPRTFGTVALLFYENVVGVYCVSISKPFRTQGLGTALMAHVLKTAQRENFQYVLGTANEMGMPLYSKVEHIRLGETKLFSI